MFRLDDHARAQLDAYAGTVQPSAESRRRNRARLMERIATSDDPPEVTETPLPPARTGVRWSLVGIAAAALVVGGLGWALREPSQSPTSEPRTQAESTVDTTPSQPSIPRAPRSPTRSPPPLELEPPPPEPQLRPEQPRRRIKAPRRPAAVAPESPPAEATTPPRTPSQLAAEVALISEARGLVAKGRDAAALASFRRHARQFPRGVLSEERAAWLAILQCRLGRQAGSASAAAFLEHHPNSPHAARVRTTCSTSVTDDGSYEE